MTGFRWHSRTLLALFTVVAVCLTLHQASLLSAKDKPDNAAAKKKSKVPAKKKSQPKGDTSGNVSGDGSGTATGGGGIGGPGNSGSSDSSKSGNPGNAGTRTDGNAPAAGGGRGTPAAGRPVINGGANKPIDPERVRLDENHPLVAKAIKTQKRISADLMNQKGIVGTCVGLDEDDNVVIKVRTTGADNPQIPKQVDGLAVVEVLTGTIRPFQQGGFNTQARLPRPVPIGVSGISENGQCFNPSLASGTLGCRLRDGAGNVYILSNNHVLAAENAGVIGDLIVQPGSLDAFFAGIPFCAPQDVVGTLFKFKPIDFIDLTGNTPIIFNVLDAAVAKTDVDQIGNSTPPAPIAYGTPRTTTWKRPFLGLKVQKLGRTSGYTKGFVSGLNVITFVVYSFGIAAFDQQVEFLATGTFSLGSPGDSGSLIVTDDGLGQRFPVALLFAGGGGFTDGNPIQPVLDYFGMTIDGDDSSFPSPGKNGRSAPNEP